MAPFRPDFAKIRAKFAQPGGFDRRPRRPRQRIMPPLPAACEIRHPKWRGALMAQGDASLLARPQTAFFCSQQYPAKAVLPSYRWAKRARADGVCVISGFHSPLERNVLDILLSGEQPIVWAFARSLPKRPPPPIRRAMENGRLLSLSPTPPTIARPSAATAALRNRFIVAVAHGIVVAHAAPSGALSKLLTGAPVACLT